MRDKRAVALCVLLGVLAVYGLIGTILFLKNSRNVGTVEIVRAGEVLYRFSPDDMKEDRDIEIEYGEERNLVHVGPDGVWMKDANCADRTCVECGKRLPIICLPHALTIRSVNTAGDVDATSY